MLAAIVIDPLTPRLQGGIHPAKATVGEPRPVTAQVLKDGHDLVGVALEWRTPSGGFGRVAMHPLGDDRYGASFTPTEPGFHTATVIAWTDRYATWRRDVVSRVQAGQDVVVELEVGARILESLARRAGSGSPQAPVLEAAAAGLRRGSCTLEVRLSAGLDDAAAAAAEEVVGDADYSEGPPIQLWVDRELAGSSAWYELFPRSFGGFRGVIDELPRLSELGFDVLYLPPIHPIGTTHRKGRNNTLVAGPADVGSPWAIGSAEGGHIAIEPGLGTEADFTALVCAARDHGIEVALDYALQCSPDHPWVTEHPEWFHRRPDGSIRYAENPPKKYQDIYPINFWPDAEDDRQALWAACRDAMLHWVERGVRIFRVDNPHTKPVAFWAWLIDELRVAHPDVLLLAEAFTNPAMMAKLGEIGFAQSYTYFTWRRSAAELRAYVEELCREPLVSTMRPNFWPNTPDILEAPLRDAPLATFALRYVAAATLVPNHGIYSGYELGENTPASPDNTEYLDSEKYQLVQRDFSARPNLDELIRTVNRARHEHPALRRLAGTRFHDADDDAILVWSRCDGSSGDTVIVVLNLDPDRVRMATLTLDLAALGVGDGAFEVDDLLSGETYRWQGPHPWVRLDPAHQPAHLLVLREGNADRRR
ncbi:MAG: DUF3416 domain-containing protein [Acidimicrobiia bacterium]|nr:DUF3416 domain-containing protein [Acidimicrobiia bacterium]